MSEQKKATWTVEEYEQFDKIVTAMTSSNQVKRIESRAAMAQFVKDHGKEKCNDIWDFMEGGVK